MKYLLLILTFTTLTSYSQSNLNQSIKEKLENDTPYFLNSENVIIKDGKIVKNKGLINWMEYDGAVKLKVENNKIITYPGTENCFKISSMYSDVLYLIEGDYGWNEEYYQIDILKSVKVEDVYDVNKENKTVKIEISINPTKLGENYYQIDKNEIYTLEASLKKIKGGKYKVDNIYFKPSIEKQTNVKWPRAYY